MTTFKVNDVVPAKKPLLGGNLQWILTHRCGNVKPEAHSTFSREIVKEIRGIGRLLGMDNALVSAIHCAWSDHYPLVLTPDIIWLCIAQGLAKHINKNAEKLRLLFVEHEGKKKLTVQRDDFVKGSPHNPWQEVFESFSEQIRKHVGDKTHDLLTPTFSTTGPVERAAAQVVMMNCFKQYFIYRCICVCGIPEITLEGTVDDWKMLREKALSLGEYDLQWWVDAMKPVLDQFVSAASGDIDRQFWTRIYHHRGNGPYAPGPFVTGWILALFPYIQKGVDQVERNPYLMTWQTEDPSTYKAPKVSSIYTGDTDDDEDDTHNVGVYHNAFPPGVVSTPFIWEGPGKCMYNMHFYAGFMGVSQDSLTYAVRPEIGWAVGDDATIQETKQKSEKSRAHIYS